MAAVQLARPQANVQFVPVSSVLSFVLNSPFLRAVPFADLFEDNAPHGQPSTYFLAAQLITYISITGQAPPADYAPSNDGVLLPEVVDNYGQIVGLIIDLLETGTPPPIPPVAAPTDPPVAPVAPVAAPTDPPVAPVVVVTDAPSAQPVEPPSPPTGNDPCCIQPEITGSDQVCTTVDYCNQQESHCIGDCEGDWVVLGGNNPEPTQSPVVAPPPPTSAPADAPTAFPTTSPTLPPTTSSTDAPSPGSGTDPCCIQEEITGSTDVCTTVDYCNESQSNCLGDCEGHWGIIVGGPPPPSPSPVVTPTPPTPTTGGGEPCCIQEDFAGPGCTTVAYCNENESNCTGDCEGVWSAVDGNGFWSG